MPSSDGFYFYCNLGSCRILSLQLGVTWHNVKGMGGIFHYRSKDDLTAHKTLQI